MIEVWLVVLYATLQNTQKKYLSTVTIVDKRYLGKKNNMSDKQQRRLNNYIKKFNKILANDSFLGLDRFSVNQLDKRGRFDLGDRVYLLEVFDSKICQCSTFIVNDYDYRRKIFWTVNDFIIQVRLRESW